MFRPNPVQGLSIFLSAAITATFVLALTISPSGTPKSKALALKAPTQHVSFTLVDNGVVVAKKDHVAVRSGPISLDLVPTDKPARPDFTKNVNLDKVSLEVSPSIVVQGSPTVQGWVSFSDASVALVADAAKNGQMNFTEVSKIHNVRLPWDMNAKGPVLSIPLTSGATAMIGSRVLRITLEPSLSAAAKRSISEEERAAREARNGA
jgi:hypothetical protein